MDNQSVPLAIGRQLLSLVVVGWCLAVNAKVPFICECCDTACRDVIRVPWVEFAALHRDGNLFVVVPGHEHLEVEHLVGETRDYNVVEK